jgi:hypothetical protein
MAGATKPSPSCGNRPIVVIKSLIPRNKEWVVRDAVRSEPVSLPFSLLSPVLQGNLLFFSLFSLIRPEYIASLQ